MTPFLEFCSFSSIENDLRCQPLPQLSTSLPFRKELYMACRSMQPRLLDHLDAICDQQLFPAVLADLERMYGVEHPTTNPAHFLTVCSIGAALARGAAGAPPGCVAPSTLHTLAASVASLGVLAVHVFHHVPDDVEHVEPELVGYLADFQMAINACVAVLWE